MTIKLAKVPWYPYPTYFPKKWYMPNIALDQSGVGIKNCTKPSLGIKINNHGYQKVKYTIYDI